MRFPFNIVNKGPLCKTLVARLQFPAQVLQFRVGPANLAFLRPRVHRHYEPAVDALPNMPAPHVMDNTGANSHPGGHRAAVHAQQGPKGSGASEHFPRMCGTRHQSESIPECNFFLLQRALVPWLRQKVVHTALGKSKVLAQRTGYHLLVQLALGRPPPSPQSPCACAHLGFCMCVCEVCRNTKNISALALFFIS